VYFKIIICRRVSATLASSTAVDPVTENVKAPLSGKLKDGFGSKSNLVVVSMKSAKSGHFQHPAS
jgi:hypothetical protein